MDSFFGIGFMELAFIAILALIVLGPERLPGAAREVAKIYQQIRGLSTELTSQFSEELKILDDLNPQKLMNDLVEDATNPSKKKPKPKTKPLATKKPAKTKPATKSDSKDADIDADADVTASAESAPTNDTEQAEENRILPPQPDETIMADNEPPVATVTHPDSNPAAPSEHLSDDAAVDAMEATAQKQTDKSA